MIDTLKEKRKEEILKIVVHASHLLYDIHLSTRTKVGIQNTSYHFFCKNKQVDKFSLRNMLL